MAFLVAWSFTLSYGNVAHADPDVFAAETERLLQDARLEDMRSKLDASGHANRIAALVFDSTTGTGWATAQLADAPAPSMAIRLPDEITHVLVLGMNGLKLLYSDADGWTSYGG